MVWGGEREVNRGFIFILCSLQNLLNICHKVEFLKLEPFTIEITFFVITERVKYQRQVQIPEFQASLIMQTLNCNMYSTTFGRPQSQQDNHGMYYKNVHCSCLSCSPTEKHLVLRF